MAVMIVLTGCQIYSTLDEKDLFLIPFGTAKGELGFKGLNSKKKFIFDERNFSQYLKFHESTVSFLDINNSKLLQFDQSGKLLIDYKIVNTNKNSFLAIDDDKNIFYLEEGDSKMICNRFDVHSKKLTSYDIGTKFNNVKSFIDKSKVGVSQVRNVFCFDDDFIAVVGHSAYQMDLHDKNGKFTVVTADRVVIIDTKKNAFSAIPLKLDQVASTTNGYYRIMRVSPIYNSERGEVDFLLETDFYQVKEKSVIKERKLFIFNRETLKTIVIKVPLKKWSAVIGTSGSKIFLLKEVKVTEDEVIVLITVLNSSNRKMSTIQIKNGINAKHIGELLISRDGNIFSYKLTEQGLRIISWKK